MLFNYGSFMEDISLYKSISKIFIFMGYIREILEIFVTLLKNPVGIAISYKLIWKEPKISQYFVHESKNIYFSFFYLSSLCLN